MSGERFTIDTNVLVYSVDRLAGDRHDRAVEVLDRSVECDCHLTLQALSEFFVVTSRKGLMPREAAAAQVEDWLILFPTIAASRSAVRVALSDAAAGRASYWDALLVATAAEAGCKAILTEDLSNDGRLGDIRIHNPFAEDGRLSIGARTLLGLAPGAG